MAADGIAKREVRGSILSLQIGYQRRKSAAECHLRKMDHAVHFQSSMNDDNLSLHVKLREIKWNKSEKVPLAQTKYISPFCW